VENHLVRAQIVAQQYGVTSETVRGWARRGWIPCRRAGRRPILFDMSEVDAALRRRARQEIRRD
jgi:hypothetical protein